MKAITFKSGISITSKYGPEGTPFQVICPPGERLVFDEDLVSTFMGQEAARKVIIESDDIGPRIRAMKRPDHWRGARVLFFRNRGLGDQLILSALPSYFTEQLGARSYVLTCPWFQEVWEQNRYIGNFPIKLPCNLDRTLYSKNPFYQGFFCFESVTEWDNDPEQDNVYDRMFAMCGIDPLGVQPKWKRPYYEIKPNEKLQLEEFLNGIDGSKFPNWPNNDYFVFQILATNVPRCPPAHVVEKVLSAADEHAMKLGIPILCLHDNPNDVRLPEFKRIIKQFPSCIDLIGEIKSIRAFATIISRARLVIGPDSSALHFAAAFSTPALGLWGPFDPLSRHKYSENQLHLHHPDRCPNAPCYNWLPSLPVNKCPNGEKQQFCEPFDGIGTEEVYSAIKELLKL
jgi:ADP-heptose:LPS heptosyltransferase